MYVLSLPSFMRTVVVTLPDGAVPPFAMAPHGSTSRWNRRPARGIVRCHARFLRPTVPDRPRISLAECGRDRGRSGQSGNRTVLPSVGIAIGRPPRRPRRQHPLHRPAAGEMEMLAAGGFKVVRMDFAWNATERQAGRVRLLRLRPTRGGVRGEAHPADVHPRLRQPPLRRRPLAPHDERRRWRSRDWAAAAAEHFKGRGIIWEMYNEPNIQFWRPRPNADDYAKLAVLVGEGAAPRRAGRDVRRPRDQHDRPAVPRDLLPGRAAEVLVGGVRPPVPPGATPRRSCPSTSACAG